MDGKLIKGKVSIDKRFIRKKAVDGRIFGAFMEHLGDVIYNGIYNPSHPQANAEGFRSDVISLVKELHLTQIRYPGGNYICSYFWEDAVGPVEKRPVRADLAWRQTEPNTVGLAEFESWVKAVGSSLMMAVNLSTRGPVDAANLVEYCNYQGDTFYSSLRKLHGHEEPYGIRLWCVGNEVDGPWNIGTKKAEVYGWDAKEAAKAMRRMDEEIELVAVGSSGTQLDTYLEWDRTVLEETYDSFDYISLHRYMGMDSIEGNSTYDTSDIGDYLELAGRLERNIIDVAAACDYVKGRKHSNKTMYISLDEYNVINNEFKPNAPVRTEEETVKPWQIGPAGYTRGLSMGSTLLFGLSMIVLLRHSDRVRIACQSILINGGGGLVMCGKEGDAWVNGTYHIFRHCSLYGRGKVLEQRQEASTYDTSTCKNVSALDSVCIYHEDTAELDVFVVNKSKKFMEFSLDAACFGNLGLIEQLVVRSDSLSDHNSAVHKDVIRSVSRADIIEGDEGKCFRLEPYSWNVIRLKER